ncbi:MAG: uncharacterized protein JWL62_294 [Hyphomicrobiales bacterium]|nr:uncharacterized protein [Hyphomicrobiales bacterium]
MKSLSTRVSHLALISAALSLSASPLLAADITIPAGTTSTGQKSFGGTDKVTVGAGATLTSTSNPTLNQTSAATGVVIDNAGTIESTGATARAIRFNSGTAMTFTLTNQATGTIQSATNDALQIGTNVSSGTIIVNNYGTMQAIGVNGNNGQAIDFGNILAGTASVTINNYATGVIQTADADGIRPGNNATVNNYGHITANNFLLNTGADGLDFQTSTGGTVNNYDGGVISGGRHGVNISYDPLANATTSSVTVTNYAGGQIIGRNGSGVGSDVSGTVVNYGLISGRADSIPGALNGDGDGVDIDYTGNITNYGIIEGTGAKGVGSDGLTNTSQGVAIGGGVIDNKAGATIRGQADGILVDNSSEGPAFSAVTITNAGTIEGTTRYGVFINSTLNNTLTDSGTITGGNGQAIVFGSGNDTLNIRTGSIINGTVDGGAGTDNVSLSGTGTFAGATNFESLSVDDGVWTLTNTQSYANGVSVAGGAELVAAGTIGNLVTIASGARLSGTGTLGAMDLSGTVSPGTTAGEIATLSITGNATFHSGAIYQVDANASGAADKIAVTGSAALAGSVAVAAASGNYAPQTTYTIVSAAGGVTGQFASVSTDLAFLTPSLSYDGNDAYLNLTRNGTFFQSVAATRNQSAVAGALDQAPTDSPLFFAIVGKSAAGAKVAFDALSGEGMAGALNLGLQANRLFTSVLSDQGQLWRTGGADANGITVTDETAALGYAPVSKSKSPIKVKPVVAPVRTLRMWATGFGESTRIAGESGLGTASQKDRLWGGALGLDAQVAPNALLGIAAGYSDGRATTDQRNTRVNVEGWHLGTYGLMAFDPFYVSASLTFSAFRNSSDRSIIGAGPNELATGRFDSNVLRGHVEIGRDFAWSGWKVTPFLAMEAARINTDAFSETSSPLGGGVGFQGLTYAARSVDSLPLSLGLRMQQTFALGNGMSLTPSLALAWVHEFSPDRTLVGAFSSLPNVAFTVAGARPDRDMVRAKAGASLQLSRDATLFTNIEGEFGDRTRTFAAKGGVKIAW